MDNTRTKERYLAPLTEVLDISSEGVVCGSLDTDPLPGFTFTD